MVDEREGRKRLFGLETHNQSFRNMNSLVNSMEEANNINFIPSFHQPQNKKINLFLFWLLHSSICWWMEWLKKYYNSTVIRAGIYLLSAIMKNFVLNYERQLVDDCDNNAPPIQFFSFLNELLFLMGNSKKRKKNWRALGPKGTVQQFNSINFVDLDWICCCSCGGQTAPTSSLFSFINQIN